MKKRILFGILLVLSLLTTLGTVAGDGPVTLYVDDDKVECPYATYTSIQAAVGGATEGDTIIVCPGTYDETVTIDALLTLQADDGAIIRPTSGTTGIYITHDDVKVQGFEIDGSGGTLHYGIYAFNANGVTVRSNTVHDLLYNPDDVSGVGILYFGWDQGIDNGLIERNTVYNTARMGIFVGGCQGPACWPWLLSSNNVIERNNVYKAWEGPTEDGGGAVQINAPKDCAIRGNVIHQTQSGWFYAGIYTYAPDEGNVVAKNNIHHNYIGIATWGSDNVPELEANKLHQNALDTFGFP